MRKGPVPETLVVWVEIPAIKKKANPPPLKSTPSTSKKPVSTHKARSTASTRAKDYVTGSNEVVSQRKARSAMNSSAKRKISSYDAASSDSPSTTVTSQPASRRTKPRSKGITVVSDPLEEDRIKLELATLELASHEANIKRREQELAEREKIFAMQLKIQEESRIDLQNGKKAAEEMKRKAEELLQMAQDVSEAVENEVVRTTYLEQEEALLCPICMVVMASPCIITTPDCGHTVCAACALRIYFNEMCGPCGIFHEGIKRPACPTCRKPMTVLYPDTAPRNRPPPPFIFNRIASNIVDTHIQKMRSLDVKDWLDEGEGYKAWVVGSGVPRRLVQQLIKCWQTTKGTDFGIIKRDLDKMSA